MLKITKKNNRYEAVATLGNCIITKTFDEPEKAKEWLRQQYGLATVAVKIVEG